jgi:tRNA dimethylallyltransferase
MAEKRADKTNGSRTAKGREGIRERMSHTLHVLTGPTAVGKTELALRWAEANHAEIVSCDALLFYRGMDIGTAKPTAEERARVPHHLIDVCEVNERMDVTYYVTKAQAAVADITSRGRKVLVAGGSGFYLKAFFAPVADAVAVAPELRAEIEAKLAAEGLGALVAELRGLNPRGLGELDTDNSRRVTRALERCRSSGRTLRELAEDFARQPGAFAEWTVICTRLDRPPEELDRRIKARVDAMLTDGLVDEVRRLRSVGIEGNPSASRAIGYRETLAMLDRQLPEAGLAAEIAKNTRGLVKKQRTWFRTQLPEHRVVAAAEATVAALFA